MPSQSLTMDAETAAEPTAPLAVGMVDEVCLTFPLNTELSALADSGTKNVKPATENVKPATENVKPATEDDQSAIEA